MTHRNWTFALAAVAGLCAAGPASADEAEDKAVKFVEKLGGQANRDNSKSGKPVIEVFLWDSTPV
ncbi:MAG TPA: hypothetical protein VKE74_26385, partial [Gemmataceae bacterium]|nr:hypothetical protein [Gemmataceae bacterium]